ncbi:MAG: hypothetical protein PHS49_05845 [Candidatus Gracilibacteria bacterium]|nr:hypothetical protein [Candidatus Gracilibacteria bacterium]
MFQTLKNFFKKEISNKKTKFNTDLLDLDKNAIKSGPSSIQSCEDVVDQTKSNVQVAVENENPKSVSLGANSIDDKKTSSVDLNKKSISFDVLDLSTVIDIYAEMKAVEAFDKEMRDSKTGGLFKKIGGFFKRSFQRMGRDAWIDSQKKKYIDEVNEGLDKGIYTEDSIRNHVLSSDKGIENKAFLSHEELVVNDKAPDEIQKIINEWLNIDIKSEKERKAKIAELKVALENNYPEITTDLSQLEKSLIRLEKAKIQGELETIDAKLNILDIGRIEDGYGQREEGTIVKFLDKINSGINNSVLPDWVKKYVGGLVQHPNTAAVVSAIGTRTIVSGLAGVSILSGFIAPVAVGALAGGVLAAGRARREMRDRTAQIDRRGALGNKTGSKVTDGNSSNFSHVTEKYQHSAMDLYNKIALFSSVDANDKNYSVLKEEALRSGIYYLVKHLVGRETGLNMLQYDNNKSVSSQHVETIILLNKLFPGLVSSFNSKELFNESNDSKEAQLAKEIYKQISDLAYTVMDKREEKEKKYATKQGLIYAGIAAGVGASVAGILSLNSGHIEVVGNTESHYSDNLKDYSNVKRDFWFDNKTVKFDHTELMIHTDKAGGWNVSNMISKTPFTNGHSLNNLSGSDFVSNKVQAVVTPKIGGPSFVLPIDAHGNIQIPQSMQEAFNNRSFAFLEVGKVDIDASGTIHLEPIATVKGANTMIFDKISGEEITQFVADDNNWYGIPFGGNRYHELGETGKKEPVGEFVRDDGGKGPDGVKGTDLVPVLDNKGDKNDEKTVSKVKLPGKLLAEFDQAFANGMVRSYRIVKKDDGEIVVYVKNSDGEFEIASEQNGGIPRAKYLREMYEDRIKNELSRVKVDEEENVVVDDEISGEDEVEEDEKAKKEKAKKIKEEQEKKSREIYEAEYEEVLKKAREKVQAGSKTSLIDNYINLPKKV